MRTRLVGPGALVTSAGVHGLALALGAWLLSQSFGSRSAKSPPVAPAPVEVSVEAAPLQLPELRGESASSITRPSELEVDPLALESGGGRARPRPDLERAGLGGSRDAAQAANLASSVDPLTLDRDPINHRERSQVQRLRTSAERRTLDDRRATPTPMQLEFVVSGSGQLYERRPSARSNPAQGARQGERPSDIGAALGGVRPTEPGLGPEPPEGASTAGADERRVQAGIRHSGATRDYRFSARVATARPWVPQARPAVPALQRDRQNDSEDSRQEVSSRVASLIHASTAGGDPGSGVGGEARGGQPGTSGKSGLGSRSSPAGRGPGRELHGDSGLMGYQRALRDRVEREIEKAFPKWAIAEGRSGLVVIDVTLLRDGSIAEVNVVRASGIDEYDHNLVSGIKRLGSIGPITEESRERIPLRLNCDSLNLVIGRDGPGPGGRGK